MIHVLQVFNQYRSLFNGEEAVVERIAELVQARLGDHPLVAEVLNALAQLEGRDGSEILEEAFARRSGGSSSSRSSRSSSWGSSRSSSSRRSPTPSRW